MIQQTKIVAILASASWALVVLSASTVPLAHGADNTDAPPLTATATTEAASPVPSLPQQWHFSPPPVQVQIPTLTDPVAEHGIVYFGDSAGTLRAADPQSDKILWGRALGGQIESLIIDEKQMYVAGTKGIDAVQKGTGESVWHFNIPGGAGNCAVLAAADMLFVGGNDGLLYALDRNTAEKKWTHSMLDDNVVSSPDARFGGKPARPTGICTDGKYVYLSIFDQSRVIACDAASGDQRWSFVAKAWIYGAAAFDEHYVFVGTQDNFLYCLARETGEVEWKFETKSRIESTPTVLAGLVIFPSCDGCLYAVNIATAKLAWKFEADRTDKDKSSAIYSTPLIWRDAVWFAAGEGHIYGLDPANGKLLFKFCPSEESELYSSLAANDTHLFVTTRQKIHHSPDAPTTGENAIFAFTPAE